MWWITYWQFLGDEFVKSLRRGPQAERLTGVQHHQQPDHLGRGQRPDMIVSSQAPDHESVVTTQGVRVEEAPAYGTKARDRRARRFGPQEYAEPP
jgi:hypothetical protein